MPQILLTAADHVTEADEPATDIRSADPVSENVTVLREPEVEGSPVLLKLIQSPTTVAPL